MNDNKNNKNKISKLIEEQFSNKLPNWKKYESKLQLIEIVVKDQNNTIQLDTPRTLITVSNHIFNEFRNEVQLFDGWYSLLKMFLSVDLAVDISFAIIYFDIDASRKDEWIEIWRRSLVTNTHLQVKTNFFNVIPWFSIEKHAEVLNDIFELLKMKIQVNFDLDSLLIYKHLHNLFESLIPPPKLPLLETLKLIVKYQTDNAMFLFKEVKNINKSHSTLTRHINKLYQVPYLLKRYIPNFDLLGLTNIHLITQNFFSDENRGYNNQNPWLFSYYKGYGCGQMNYYQFITPTENNILKIWHDIGKDYQNSNHTLLIKRYKEPEFLFSNFFWKKSKETWIIDEEVLNGLASTLNTGYISDSLLEHSGRKVSRKICQLSKFDYELINTINKLRSYDIREIKKVIYAKDSVLKERTKFIKINNLLSTIFYPTFKMFPERFIIFIQTDLSPYDNLYEFLQYLPYVKIETTKKVYSDQIWRIITILTPIGMTDIVLKVILNNFKFDDLRLFKPFDFIGTNWIIPHHLYEDDSNSWTYDWGTFKNETQNLMR